METFKRKRVGQTAVSDNQSPSVTLNEVAKKAVETFKRKRVGQTALSDNQSSSVTLNELAKKARRIYCNFEFHRRSHSMTEMNLNRASNN